jgi:3',5'-cyclic AMP phosphodiesterase CpdA
VLIAHLSDLHLRDAGDATWLDRQLDRIADRSPDHLALTGDLLDRWTPSLLERVLDALAGRGLLHPDRTTILHGNHDLASSGGHPRRGADLWRLAFRFWDPPPLIVARRRRFYHAIVRRSPGVAADPPYVKTLPGGARVAVIDTVPVPWRPFRRHGRTIVVQHAIGCVRTRDIAWLEAQRGDGPLIVLMHHYPLPTAPFHWTPPPAARRLFTSVDVPMAIPEADRDRLWRAAGTAGARLVLCGHVHRARLERHGDTFVGLNGQSGAAWAGRTIAYYTVEGPSVRMEWDKLPDRGHGADGGHGDA